MNLTWILYANVICSQFLQQWDQINIVKYFEWRQNSNIYKCKIEVFIIPCCCFKDNLEVETKNKSTSSTTRVLHTYCTGCCSSQFGVEIENCWLVYTKIVDIWILIWIWMTALSPPSQQVRNKSIVVLKSQKSSRSDWLKHEHKSVSDIQDFFLKKVKCINYTTLIAWQAQCLHLLLIQFDRFPGLDKSRRTRQSVPVTSRVSSVCQPRSAEQTSRS